MMEKLKQLWTKFDGSMSEAKALKLIVVLVAALVLLYLTTVLDVWVRRHAIESDAAMAAQSEAVRKLEFAREMDRITLDRARREANAAGSYVDTKGLDKLGDIFLRVGPYALLFFSIAQAWRVFNDQRSSRLRLALAVSFSVIVVGFVLIVGGYVAQVTLNMGGGDRKFSISSESLGMVTVVLGAFMATAAFAAFRPTKPKAKGDDEGETGHDAA